MNTKRFWGGLLACLLVLSCLAVPVGAAEVSASTVETAITRATGQFEASIPSQTIAYVRDDVLLDRGEIVTFDCTYTPRDASVKFGYIGPDGVFYGLSGSAGSISKGIQVNQRGTYTLAIWNKSSEAVTVKGTVNY